MCINSKRKIYLYFCVFSAVVVILSYLGYRGNKEEKSNNRAAEYYQELSDNAGDDNPLEFIDENFYVDRERFVSNLPLVVIHKNEEMQEYKSYIDGEEVVNSEIYPWIGGSIELYNLVDGKATLNREADIKSNIKIKKRGHTSFFFDKSQYYIKLVNDKNENNPQNVFGMGTDDDWILNGSMADKSMLRNYLAYRISAQIMEYAPRSCYCEMFTEEDGKYKYQGVYLMLETVKQSESRVAIDESKRKNIYTSYLVRRDRYTNYDTMLETYARINDLDNEYIGLKYPTKNKETKENIAYIENDFSNIEKIIYSEKKSIFRKYPGCIDMNSFADYFIINEYFGNYDAGLHSTYMYKNSGDKLKIGPVWDFDQAMNNSMIDEADPFTIAMQEKAIYKQIFKDKEFVELVKKKYSKYRESFLSDEYVFGVIEETEKHLKAAQKREWYRWAEDYYDKNAYGLGKYILSPYTLKGIEVSRMNDRYEQEVYTIRTYLSVHGNEIQTLLSDCLDSCEVTTGIKGEMTVIMVICLIIFMIPSIIINRK